MGSTDGLGNPLAAPLSYNQAVAAAYAAGFRGNALVDAVAISKRESGFVPNNYNGNVSTGDNSIGMMQIDILTNSLASIENMLNNIGITAATRNDVIGALNNPVTNFKVAYQMSNGGSDGFFSWGPYKGQSALYDTDVPSAQAAVNAFLAESPSQQQQDISAIGDYSLNFTTTLPDQLGGDSPGSIWSDITGSIRKTLAGPAGISFLGATEAGAVTDSVIADLKKIPGVPGSGGVGSTLSAFTSLIPDIETVFSWILDWHNWVKLGIILAGGLLILGGIYTAAKSSTNEVTVNESKS